MSDDVSNHWYHREGGVVDQTATVEDPTAILATNAYAKHWRGLPLSAEETSALARVDASRPFEHFMGNRAGGEEVLGLIATHHPEILQTLDKMADDLSGLGVPPFAAWSTLQDYCGRACSATLEEAGIGNPEAYLCDLGTGGAEQAAFDDGPEGWSQIPGRAPRESEQ